MEQKKEKTKFDERQVSMSKKSAKLMRLPDKTHFGESNVCVYGDTSVTTHSFILGSFFLSFFSKEEILGFGLDLNA